MARIVALASGKGGTGKSTVAAGLSLSLARLGRRVLVVDLDTGLRALDLLLGMESRVVYDMGDVLQGRCPLQDACIEHSCRKLKLLCSPADFGAAPSTEELTRLLRAAAADYDFVILDLPAGLERSVPVARALADLTALVTVPDQVSLRDARKTADELLAGSRKPCRMIINKISREAMTASGLRDLDEMLDTVALPLLAAVPLDSYINRTAKPPKRAPLTQKVFDAMARRIAGEYVPLLLRSL